MPKNGITMAEKVKLDRIIQECNIEGEPLPSAKQLAKHFDTTVSCIESFLPKKKKTIIRKVSEKKEEIGRAHV